MVSFVFSVYFPWFCVVSTSASDCLERLVSEMTYYVLSGTLNSTHSLTGNSSVADWSIAVTAGILSIMLLICRVVDVKFLIFNISSTLCAILSACNVSLISSGTRC